MNFAVMDGAVFFKFVKMVESRLFKGAGAGDGAGEKKPETVKNGPAPQHWLGSALIKKHKKATYHHVKVLFLRFYSSL